MIRTARAAIVAACLLPITALAQTGTPTGPVIDVPRQVPGAAPAPIIVTPSQPAPGSLRSDGGTPVYRVPEAGPGGQSADTGNYRAPTTNIPAGSTIIVR